MNDNQLANDRPWYIRTTAPRPLTTLCSCTELKGEGGEGPVHAECRVVPACSALLVSVCVRVCVHIERAWCPPAPAQRCPCDCVHVRIDSACLLSADPGCGAQVDFREDAVSVEAGEDHGREEASDEHLHSGSNL